MAVDSSRFFKIFQQIHNTTNFIVQQEFFRSEFGVYDQYGDQYGYIRYDDTGAAPDAVKRMFISTIDGKALKIQSSGNMSIQSNNGAGLIYIDGDVQFAKPPKGVVAVFA